MRCVREVLGPLVVGLLLSAGPSSADCPDAAAIQSLLGSQQFDQASRSVRFGSDVPFELYERAIGRPNTPVSERAGSRIQSVILAEIPIEKLWQALNDDHHHAEDGHIAVRASEVVAGRPGHSGRDLFQYYIKAGFGRWWVVHLEMNGDLYRSSAGTLWELSWQDAMESYPDPPVRMGASVSGIDSSLGAWLLWRVGERCTMMEYYAEGDPGGLAASMQWMGLTRTVRGTMEGIISIAAEHLEKPHPRGLFVRPDGVSMDAPIR